MGTVYCCSAGGDQVNIIKYEIETDTEQEKKVKSNKRVHEKKVRHFDDSSNNFSCNVLVTIDNNNVIINKKTKKNINAMVIQRFWRNYKINWYIRRNNYTLIANDCIEKFIQMNQIVLSVEAKLEEFDEDIPIKNHSLRHINLQYPNSDIYVGFVNFRAQRCSNGMLLSNNGSKYSGFFEADLFHGRGRLIYSNGDCFEGYFFKGDKHGKGVFYKEQGEICSGNWHYNKKNGYFEEQLLNADSFEGYYFEDKKHGNGELTFAGNVYRGSFENGKMSGIGELVYTNGNIYFGAFAHNKPNGLGVFMYNKHFVYKGNLVDEKRDGFGVMNLKENDEYWGFWKNDMQHGQGACIRAYNSVLFVGEWRYGKLITKQVFGSDGYNKVLALVNSKKLELDALLP